MTAVEPNEEVKTSLNLKAILVAVDLSPHSEGTALYAAEIAKKFGAKLTLVHVFEPPAAIEFGDAGHPSLMDRQQEAENSLSRLTHKVRTIYPKTRYILRVGDPSEQIIRAAVISRADLIVTARHQQTFIARLFNLHEAPKLVHRATCPVLVWQGGGHDKDKTYENHEAAYDHRHPASVEPDPARK